MSLGNARRATSVMSVTRERLDRGSRKCSQPLASLSNETLIFGPGLPCRILRNRRYEYQSGVSGLRIMARPRTRRTSRFIK